MPNNKNLFWICPYGMGMVCASVNERWTSMWVTQNCLVDIIGNRVPWTCFYTKRYICVFGCGRWGVDDTKRSYAECKGKIVVIDMVVHRRQVEDHYEYNIDIIIPFWQCRLVDSHTQLRCVKYCSRRCMDSFRFCIAMLIEMIGGNILPAIMPMQLPLGFLAGRMSLTFMLLTALLYCSVISF